MATLHIRDVPEDLYRALVERAHERDTFVSAEAVRLLRLAIALERPGQATIIDAIHRDRRPLPEGAPSAAELIRGDRGG